MQANWNYSTANFTSCSHPAQAGGVYNAAVAG
jgi:hypothetical protein